jgi:hypothetical protein
MVPNRIDQPLLGLSVVVITDGRGIIFELARHLRRHSGRTAGIANLAGCD